MAPKSLPPSAKQALILTHLRGTRTCHTLKDLEKALPAVASINGMQVKEYVQALVDDGKLRVEKIGSGNWYWCFRSEEKKEKEQVLAVLRAEKDKLDKSASELEEKIESAKASREDDGEVGERDELMARLKSLEEEVGVLRKKEEAFKAAGVGGVERMRGDITRWKGEAEVWTDDLAALEEYLEKITGGDRESVTGIKRQVYDAVPGEWTEEDGLRELGG